MASHTHCRYCGCQSGHGTEQQLEYIKSLEEKIRRLEAAARPVCSPSPSSTASGSRITFCYEAPENAEPKNGFRDWEITELLDLKSVTPNTEEEWTQRRKDVQLLKPKEVLTAFHQLVSCAQVQSNPTATLCDDDFATQGKLLEAYRNFSMHLQESTRRHIQLANFSSFLYICLCRIAANTKSVPLTDINEDMRKFISLHIQTNRKTGFPERYLRKLRASVQWPLQQAKRLRARGLQHRADEIFLISGHRPNKYCKLWETKGTEQWAEEVQIVRPEDSEIQDQISFSVPFMLKIITGPLYSLDQINTSLKTDLCQDDFERYCYSLNLLMSGIQGPRSPPSKRRRVERLPATSEPIDISEEDCDSDGEDSDTGTGSHNLVRYLNAFENRSLRYGRMPRLGDCDQSPVQSRTNSQGTAAVPQTTPNDEIPMPTRQVNTTQPLDLLRQESAGDGNRSWAAPHHPTLPADAEFLAKLISFAESLPRPFLDDACSAKTWGPDGTVQWLPKLTGLFGDTERIAEALQQLQAKALVCTEYVNKFEIFFMKQTSATHESLSMEEQQTALVAMFYSFPKSSHLEPVFFTLKGQLFTPLLARLLPSFKLREQSTGVLELAFSTLYAATYFSDRAWRSAAITIAAEIAGVLRCPARRSRAEVREDELSRLYDHTQLSTELKFCCQVVDACSNAWRGRCILSQMQAFVDKSASTEKVISAFKEFKPFTPDAPSPQEEFVKLHGEFIIAKSLRFEGRFCEAQSSFQQVLQDGCTLRSRTPWKVSPHLAEVQSEMGTCDAAIMMLEQDIIAYDEYHPRSSVGFRLRLALANCQSMKLLWAWKRDSQLPPECSVQSILQQYEELETATSLAKGIMEKHSKFVVQSGIALVHHITHNFQEALAAWERAQEAAGQLCEKPGYAAMITLYSRSQVAHSLGLGEASELRRRARELWNMVGRREFYFTGLGSIWPDILGSLEEMAGRDRIIPLTT